MNIADMQNEAWFNSERKGFHEQDRGIPLPYVVGTKIALIHTEASEVLEEVRNGTLQPYYREDGKPEGVAAELADIVIRCGDLAGILGINLEQAIIEKMSYNSGRPFMHGGKTI